jgi:RNA polymerase sigma-70 factor (ECF subfamily)
MSLEVFTQRILPMKDKLFRFALRLLQDVQEAEDAVQDVMVRIWSKKEEWGQWQSLEAYCMTATRNSCLDRLRKKRLLHVQEEKALQISSSEKDPYEKIMGKETLDTIRKCIEALPENQQLVIQLREIEGFSYNEIAEVLSMSLEQVKVNLFRGRNAIKKSIIKGEVSWNKLP